MIENSDVLLISTKKDFKTTTLKYLMQIYLEKNPYVKLINSSKNKAYNKILSQETTDDSAYKISNAIANNKTKEIYSALPIEKSSKNKTIIKPLYLFLDKEVLLYAKIKNLKFNKISDKKTKKDKIQNLIDDLEKKHPEIKQAIIQSCMKLK